jgi:hypothetical protein
MNRGTTLEPRNRTPPMNANTSPIDVAISKIDTPITVLEYSTPPTRLLNSRLHDIHRLYKLIHLLIVYFLFSHKVLSMMKLFLTTCLKDLTTVLYCIGRIAIKIRSNFRLVDTTTVTKTRLTLPFKNT